MSAQFYQKLLNEEMKKATPDYRLIKQFMFLGVKPSPTDAESGTGMIHKIATDGQLTIMEWLLETDPSQIDALSHYNRTPLHLAVDMGHIEVAKLLISRGCNVNAVTLGGLTPLHFASRNGLPEIVRLLLQIPEVDADIESTERQTAFMLATDDAVKEVFREVRGIEAPKKVVPINN
jgi:ankyrin repeat protein